MAYRGKYYPTNPKKYKGNPSQVIYRSLWERKLMVYCDRNDKVLEWGSEEFWIPYRSPLDNRVHRYFPDFLIKIKESTGKVKTYVIEVKPRKQTRPPIKKKNVTKNFIRESTVYAVNQAKWQAAGEWCKDRKIEFKIITEKELGIR